MKKRSVIPYLFYISQTQLRLENCFFTYTLLIFLLDYGKMNLLKTHEVFFIGLATTTPAKNQKNTA